MSDIIDEGTSFDAAKFRQVLGHFPTGVTVITAFEDQNPVGLAVGSFASLSLEPPQVMFGAGKASSSWPKIQAFGRFTVNVLGEDQEDVSRVFASKADDKFGELGWKSSGNGCPRLAGSMAYIDCEVADVVDSGDHYIVVGAVTDLDVLHEGGPLIFYRGGYGRFTS